jgi:hypothetical protein
LYIGYIHNTAGAGYSLYKVSVAFFLWYMLCRSPAAVETNMFYWSQCVLQTHWDHLHFMSIKSLNPIWALQMSVVITAVVQANVPKHTGHIFLLRDMINILLSSFGRQDS